MVAAEQQFSPAAVESQWATGVSQHQAHCVNHRFMRRHSLLLISSNQQLRGVLGSEMHLHPTGPVARQSSIASMSLFTSSCTATIIHAS